MTDRFDFNEALKAIQSGQAICILTFLSNKTLGEGSYILRTILTEALLTSGAVRH